MPKLFVIAGHGAGDPGACGNGYQEYERVRALAQRIKDFGGDNVILGDFNRNYYADNGISKLSYNKNEIWIVELHMDAATAAAKGGHVIIKSGFKADDYDNALANLMKEIFPGRANILVKRNNLANVNRAATKGYNYRLVENGFITNANDIKIFNERLDDIAKGYLAAFGIGAKTNVEKTEAVSTTVTTAPAKVTTSSAGLVEDGIWGKATTKALQKALGTTQDAIVSGQTRAAFNSVNRGGLVTSSWKIGSGGSLMVRALQKKLGVTRDGQFGPNTCRALQKYLGTYQDGYVSNPSNMVKALQKRLNNGSF